MEIPLPLWLAEGAPGFIGMFITAIGYIWYRREKKAMDRRAAERERRKALTPAE